MTAQLKDYQWQRGYESAVEVSPSAMATSTRLVRCVECGRVFDITDEADAAEWHYGHDCE